MRLLISVSHPAHVHLFKNLIKSLEKQGDQYQILARHKDKTTDLLDIYGFHYECISTAGTGIPGFVREAATRIIRSHRCIKNFKPDIIVSQMDPTIAIVAKLLDIPYLCLADSEPARFILKSTTRLSELVLTPSSFKLILGKNQYSYNGYKELAYLHPNNFHPDPSVLDELKLTPNDKIIVLRLISWNAHHDIGHRGIKNRNDIISELSLHGNLFISSEGKLEDEYEMFRLKISPDRMHDLLYYSTLLFTDSQTMTTEAAILGTPAIRTNSFVGDDDMGNFIELETKYELIRNFSDENAALIFAKELLKNDNIKDVYENRKRKLLDEKSDLNELLVWIVNNHPDSVKQLLS